MDIVFLIGFGLGGFAAGWYLRYRSWRNRTVVFPPSNASGQYEVRLDGRVIYKGHDLTEAKRVYKSDLPSGIVELYTGGNHTASRRV